LMSFEREDARFFVAMPYLPWYHRAAGHNAPH
jgi:hypothetical protein